MSHALTICFAEILWKFRAGSIGQKINLQKDYLGDIG